jgi:hypothetical protein
MAGKSNPMNYQLLTALSALNLSVLKANLEIIFNLKKVKV